MLILKGIFCTIIIVFLMMLVLGGALSTKERTVSTYTSSSECKRLMNNYYVAERNFKKYEARLKAAGNRPVTNDEVAEGVTYVAIMKTMLDKAERLCK